MIHRKFTTVAGLLAFALLVAPGCVSKKMFRSTIEGHDNRLAAVESTVEDHETRLDDLKAETNQKLTSLEGTTERAIEVGDKAMTTAKAAQEAAKGKLLWTVTLTDDKVKFPFGKAELSSEAMSELDQLVDSVKSYGKALYLEVEGHTDNVGNDSYNANLGQSRAAAVRDYLKDRGGIPLHAMSTISYGESRPVADNTTQTGRAQNRRVVIRVLE
jgi:outer membrane protein OmpA-like peptidoglycan-associated protein